MKTKFVIVTLIVFLKSSTVFGVPNSLSQNDNDLVDSIPFKLTEHNNISVQAIINSVDTVNLMLHSAANDVTVTAEATKNLQSITIDGRDTVKSWGGNQSSKFSTNNRLQIGRQLNESLTIWENENSGPGTDGKFGLNFFGNKIVEINFDENLLRIYHKLPEAYLKQGGFEKQDLVKENGLLFLQATSLLNQKDITNRFLIHSGFGGALLFDDHTAEKYGFSNQLKIVKESQLKDSYGNILKTKKAILPDFLLASQKLKDVPIAFFEGSIGRQKMSVLGGDLLKRFNLIFDVQNSTIYLQPNQSLLSSYSDL